MAPRENKNSWIDYVDGFRDSDFGWINFFSGIMVAASVNIFTGYCVTESPCKYQLWASFCALIASISLFLLYQRLNYIVRNIRHEVDMYAEFLTLKDRENHEKNIWKEDIKKNRLILILGAMFFVLSMLGMIGLLFFTYMYYNNGTFTDCMNCTGCLIR